MGRIAAHPVTKVLLVFAVSRVLVLMVLFTTREVLPDQLSGSIWDLLCRWDCGHYLGIAANGYVLPPAGDNTTNHAFFPLYPLLVGTLSAATPLEPLHAGLVLSGVFFVVALVYVYYYARDLNFSHRVGMLAVTLLAFAPPSVIFSAPMTESLFLLLLAAAVFHLRRGEYVASAIAAALLSATRPNGVAFVVFAVVWLIRDRGWRDFLRPWTKPVAYLPIILAPLGLFAYWAYSYAIVGDAFAHATTNHHGWGWGDMSPIEQLLFLPNMSDFDLLLLGTGVLALGIALLLLRQRLYPEFALVTASLAFFWSGGLAPWSMPRFALVLFPLAVVLGKALEHRPGAAAAVLATAGTANGLFLTIGWALRAYVV